MTQEAAGAIVVGAGIAGLVTARELTLRGIDVVVLEAADRFGGRMETLDFGGRNDAELGATWVHWTHPHTWAEMTRYGLQYVPDVPPARSVIRIGTRYVDIDPHEFDAALSSMLAKVFAGVGGRFSNPFRVTDSQVVAGFDAETIDDRIQQAGLSETELAIARGYFPAIAGRPNTEAGFATFAQWWACAGCTSEGFAAMLGGGRIAGGMLSLAGAVAAELRTEIRFNTAVTAIHQSPTGIVARTSHGAQFSAPCAVLAAPINVWGQLDIQPALPDALAAAATSNGAGVPCGHKVLIHAKGAAPRFQAILPEDEPITFLFTFAAGDDEQILVAYGNAGPIAPTRADAEALMDRVCPDLRVVEVRTHDRTGDPLLRGGWTYRRVGDLSRHLDGFSVQHGRLYFAGADVSVGLNWVDGAIATGYEAARLVLKRLHG